MIDWYPIKTAPWSQTVILTGPSGNIPPRNKFLTSGYRIKDYHMGAWYDIHTKPLSDIGWVPTHWAEMINLPGDTA